MFTVEQSVLIVIDVQGTLATLVDDSARMIKNQQALILAARILGIPILWTEQVPQKIGDTIPEIKKFLTGIDPIDKISFSCVPNKKFMEALKKLQRKELILCGIETHVCVYQTAADLMAGGYQLQIVADAVSSRSKENKLIALERIKELGGQLTSTEMIATEWIRGAEHEKFKEILALIK